MFIPLDKDNTKIQRCMGVLLIMGMCFNLNLSFNLNLLLDLGLAGN